MTILTMIGIVLSLGLPKMLVTRKRDETFDDGDNRHLSKRYRPAYRLNVNSKGEYHDQE